MAKYMKDDRIKPPRQKYVEESEFVKAGRKSKRVNPGKSDHKHVYEDIHVIRYSKVHGKWYGLHFRGRRCVQCGKILCERFFLNKNELPQDLLELPLVEIGKESE